MTKTKSIFAIGLMSLAIAGCQPSEPNDPTTDGTTSDAFDGVKVFAQDRYKTSYFTTVSTEAVAGGWIIDCEHTQPIRPDRDRCNIKTWAGQKMTKGPVPAQLGLKIHVPMPNTDLEIGYLRPSDFNEPVTGLVCGDFFVPQDQDGNLPYLTGAIAKQTIEVLKTSDCELLYGTQGQPNAKSVSISAKGFEDILKFATNLNYAAMSGQ